METISPGVYPSHSFADGTPSKTYHLEVGQITGDTTIWNPALFASSPQGQTTNTSLIGTGHLISAFVPTGETNLVFRAAISNPPTNLNILPSP